MKFARIAAVAAALGLSAQGASAAVITVTATGTVASGHDQTGMFGTADADLTGLAFTVVSTYDTALGLLGSTGFSESVGGGSEFTSPTLYPGSSTLTINGISSTVGGNLSSYYAVGEANGSSGYEDRYIVDNIATYGGIFTSILLGVSRPLNLLAEVHGECGAGGLDNCRGQFFFGQETQNGPYHEFYNNSGSFTVATYDVTVSPGGVPEPATWAMMIVGFGMVGAAVRRRRLVA